MESSKKMELLQERIAYLEKTLPEMCQNHLLWRGCSQLPCGVVRPHVISYENCVYVGGGSSGKLEFTRKVMKYDIAANEWCCLPITAYYTFSMALVRGLVTVIGGSSVITATMTNALTSFDEGLKKWCVKYPFMPTKRGASSAVSTSTHLVVVGGICDDAYTDVVEVLDTSSLLWSKVCQFPRPVSFMSIAACSLTGRLYLMGGLTDDGAVQSIFSCLLQDLVATGNQEKSESNVWKVIATSPYFRSGGTAINGKLVIASGLSEASEVTTTIHCFDPATEKWTELGEMPSAKSSCSIAVLESGQIMIVGGYLKPKNWIGSLTQDVMATVNLNVPL